MQLRSDVRNLRQPNPTKCFFMGKNERGSEASVSLFFFLLNTRSDPAERVGGTAEMANIRIYIPPQHIHGRDVSSPENPHRSLSDSGQIGQRRTCIFSTKGASDNPEELSSSALVCRRLYAHRA
ncbi:hypothetical protein OUZ56_008299 [Daphnia magna]|uniref:Uncharacterized protein n=1 Tax=Daphnia magna TaxID=35525 RepID=A0ABR0ACY5_9CRUS|nr:hypothetical protein OUZ56_008299 [Daphnia magna]